LDLIKLKTEIKKMADKKHVTENAHDEVIIAKAKDFWTRYQKIIVIVSAVVIIGVGGYYGYKTYIQNPKEEKASDAIFKAEEYYRMDSLQKALNGDGLNLGFAKVMDKYGDTKLGNLARFYAGDCYLRTGDFNKAVKCLEDFSTSEKMIQARAYKLLGDAYSELGKNDEAISNYKKAANHFKEDNFNSAEYLFYAAALSEKSGKTKEAIELYQELKDKFPGTRQSNDADKYLAKLGVYN
jgi:predicted negative regulator of RcsB-dependent stress response